MARANRVRGGGGEGGIFHITHRCHNREFLLKFARDRDAYREKLREHVKKYEAHRWTALAASLWVAPEFCFHGLIACGSNQVLVQ
jgi:hypothetical protein